MSVEHIKRKKTIPVNDKEYIELVSKAEDGYDWDEVYLKSDKEKHFVGSYYTYNYSSSREWMEYNDSYIALIKQYTYGYEVSNPIIKELFDIKTKAHIKGTDEELDYIYKLSNNLEEKDKSLKKVRKNTN